MNEELLRRFEESIASNQHRLNQIKNQLITRQPISGEDEHFFEHFAATIVHSLRGILSQLADQADAASSTSTSTGTSAASQNNKRILEGGLDHGSPKKPRIPQEPEGRAHPPTAPNRSLSLGDLHGFRGPADQAQQEQQQHGCSALSIPATTPGAPTTRSRRELATPAQKQEILAWHHAHGSNQTQTARHFDQRYPSLKLSQPLISGWLKGSSPADQPGPSPTTTTPSTHSIPTPSTTTTTTTTTTVNRRRQQKTKHVQVTEALEKWCHQAVRDRLDLNGDVIREKWREFARFYQIPPASWLKLSEGWLSSFKERNGLKGFKRAGAHTNPPASAARKTAARAPPKAKPEPAHQPRPPTTDADPAALPAANSLPPTHFLAHHPPPALLVHPSHSHLLHHHHHHHHQALPQHPNPHHQHQQQQQQSQHQHQHSQHQQQQHQHSQHQQQQHQQQQHQHSQHQQQQQAQYQQQQQSQYQQQQQPQQQQPQQHQHQHQQPQHQQHQHQQHQQQHQQHQHQQPQYHQQHEHQHHQQHRPIQQQNQQHQPRYPPSTRHLIPSLLTSPAASPHPMHVGGTERGPADGHPCSREASVRPPTASASPPTTGGSDIPPAAEGTSGPLAYPFLHGPPAPRPPFPLPHRASPASLDTGLRPAHHSFPDLLLPATLHPGLATLPSQGPLRHANPLFDARLAPPPALSLPARAPGLPGPQIHARPPRPGGAEDPPPPPSPRPASPPPDPRLSLLPSPLPHLHPGPANMLHLAHFHA